MSLHDQLGYAIDIFAGLILGSLVAAALRLYNGVPLL